MKIIADLESSRLRTMGFFMLEEKNLIKTYGPGKWNVRQILHHLADAESVLYDRIRRTIARPNQVVWGFDQDAWCDELGYNQMPMNIAKDLFSAARNGIIYQAQQHYSISGHHVLIHSGDGKKTLKDVFDKVVWHTDQHLSQIEKALELS